MNKAPKVLAFDVFGTVVDWHGSIAAEVTRLGLPVDPDAFATAWRQGYRPAMARVRSGELPWTKIDDLHHMILIDVLKAFKVHSLSENQIQHLNLVWHRLSPWPETVVALNRLKQKYILCTLSNGNINLLTRMAKRAGLPWDCVLSAEVFHAYKPDPKTYSGVARVFDVSPREVMLVAAHHDDLEGAKACGLQTAYVERPHEFGLGRPKDVGPRLANDFHAHDLNDLANQLGC
jgi:2-haloacid dehalogenase